MHTFFNRINGCEPQGSLALNHNTLYGTTYGSGSGPSPYGAVFRIMQ